MQTFLDGLKALMRRKVLPASFNAAEWQAVAPAIRQRSFFSATVESAKVLSRFRRMLLDWQAAATEDIVSPAGVPTKAYKISGLAEFRARAGDLLIQEGLATPDDFKDNSITNVASMSRLKLIFNTNTQQAQEFAAYEMRVTNANYLNLFPAARFVRRPGAIEPRLRHVAAQGQVRRWDDFTFWLRQNAADIGGFEVPWGPWGFNSYMTQEPVGRKEAEALGLVKKGERLLPLNLTPWGVTPKTRFNQGVEAEMDDVTPEIRQQAIDTIRARLGPGAVGNDGKLSLETMIRIRNLKATEPLPVVSPVDQALKSVDDLPDGKWITGSKEITTVAPAVKIDSSMFLHRGQYGSIKPTNRTVQIKSLSFSQEAINPNVVREIIKNYDPTKIDRIIVLEFSDGKLVVLNGHHRATAFKLLNRKTIEAEVIKIPSTLAALKR